MLRQPNLGQRTGKTEAVQQTKAEGNQPRQTLRKTRLSMPCIQNLDGNQHDAECYARFHRRAGTFTKPSVAATNVMLCAMVNAVTVSSDTPPVSDQDHKRQNKKEMVEAEQDVFDAKAKISCSHFSRGRRSLDNERRPCRRKPFSLCGPVETLDPHQYVRGSARQALDGDRLSGEPCIAAY